MISEPHEMHELIDQYLNRQLNTEQRESFKELLRSDEQFRFTYLHRLELEAAISERFSAAHDLAGFDQPVSKDAETSGIKVSRRTLRWATSGLVAMILLVGVVWASGFVYVHYIEPQATYLEATSGLKFAQLSEGELIRRGIKRGQWVEIKSGIVSIQFRSGAILNLQGPARLKVVHSEKAYLEFGTLTAEVPPEASGFLVQTDSLELIDWGTEFLIESIPEQKSTAIVRTGLCGGRPVINGRPRGEYQEITAGNALTFPFSRTAYQGGKPPRDWIPAHALESFSTFDQSLSGIKETDGHVLILRELPNEGNPFAMPASQHIYAIKEGPSITIDQPLTYGSTEGYIHLSPGMKVQSYLLQLAEVSQDGIRSRFGEVIFEGKILGVITDSHNLLKSDEHFLTSFQPYPDAISRGINFKENPNSVQIDETRHQLSLQLQNLDGWFDHMRVLVEVADEK